LSLRVKDSLQYYSRSLYGSRSHADLVWTPSFHFTIAVQIGKS